MSSSIGNLLKVTLFGESHSVAVGVVIDRLPAGFTPDMDRVAAFMARRTPGNSALTSARREADIPEILCGLYNGKTCGTPLTAIFRNSDVRSEDYAAIAALPRPGHADFTMDAKTGGCNDPRGGGHSSARLTVGLCFAGALCLQYLEQHGIAVKARIHSVGTVVNTAEDGLDAQATAEIENAKNAGDSVGGIVECVADGLPAGLGEPIFDGVENRLAQAIFGIPAVKGIEFGNGFAAAALRGSGNNDSFIVADGKIRTATNNHGGILGGITSGMPLTFRVAFKPTPSIAKTQQTVNMRTLQPGELEIRGRHDPCVVVRAVPIVEAVTAITLLDLILVSRRLHTVFPVSRCLHTDRP